MAPESPEQLRKRIDVVRNSAYIDHGQRSTGERTDREKELDELEERLRDLERESGRRK